MGDADIGDLKWGERPSLCVEVEAWGSALGRGSMCKGPEVGMGFVGP